MHLAAKTDRADIVGYYLNKGLSTQIINRDGLKPKELASKVGVKDMLAKDNELFNLNERLAP